MATIKEINHDSSTTIGDFYGTVTDTDSAITITVAAALENSTNGINCNYDAGSSTIVLVETFTFSTNDFRWRYIVKLDGVTNNSNLPQAILNMSLEDSSTNDVFQIKILAETDSSFSIEAKWKTDGKGGGLTTIGGPDTIPSSGEVCVELRAIKETGAGNDGEVELFLDGVSIQSTTAADNATAFATIVQMRATFDSTNPPNGVSGNLFYDEWLLDDDNTTEIGCVAFSGFDLVLGGGQP